MIDPPLRRNFPFDSKSIDHDVLSLSSNKDSLSKNQVKTNDQKTADNIIEQHQQS